MPVDHDMLVPLSQKGQPSGSYAMMDGMRPDTAYGMTAPLISRRLMYCSHGRYFSLYQQRKPSYTSSGVRRTLGSCVGRAKTRCTAREIAWFYWYTEVQYNNVKKTCIALLLLGQRVHSLRQIGIGLISGKMYFILVSPQGEVWQKQHPPLQVSLSTARENAQLALCEEVQFWFPADTMSYPC